jgi:plastocyanin
MFITNSCNHQWEYNESSDRHDFVGYDCRYGSYNLSIHNDDNGSHVDDIVGEISTDDPEFIFGEVHKNHRDYSEEFAFFPYYDTYDYQLTAGDDTAYFYSVQEADDNQTLMVWLYDGSFDSTQWYENLMYVSNGFENDDDSGGYDYNHSYFNMSEFEPGTYIFVTTGQHTHTNGSYDAGVYAKDGVALASWSGQLDDSDDRAYFTYGHHEYYQNNNHGDNGDDFGNSIFANIESWRDGSQTGVAAANNIVDIFWAADAAGMFHGDDNNHCDDGHCDVGGHCDDGHCGGGDGSDRGECPFTSRDICETLQYICDTETGVSDSVRCGQEVAHYCMENDDPGCAEVTTACTSPVSTENASICAVYNDFDHDAFHDEYDGGGGVYLDGVEGEETPHNWEDMRMLDPENIVGDIMLHDNSSIIISNEFVLTFNPVDNTLSEHIFELIDIGDDMRYHCWSEPGMSGHEMEISFDLVNDGTEDCGDGADEPQDMNGDGINDSWFDCNDGTQVNMEKTNDGTEDCLNGADEGVYLDDESDFDFTFNVLPEYEIISCINCSDSVISDDKTTVTFTISNGDEEISIVFGDTQPEDLPDCDYVIGIDASGIAFDSSDLEINAGETVCWQWENAVDQHNVVEIVGEFDAAVDLTEVSVGFSSGEPSNDVDFRHTFTEDDKTHYYVCEPHATMGMVGKITVGEGTPDDPVEEIEESGLPSVGFVVGALVLVGAAGLRRRIH